MIKQHSAAGSASQARRAATGTGALFTAILLLGGCGDRATPNESEGAVTAGTNQQDVLNEMGGMGSPAVMPGIGRSEEHTSELQSLMRHSYADFCFKKQKIKDT